ncbi:cell growth regulator with EF hand domain protein 1 [Periophthalmus magnuspinnatus]|uniref:cell growth regulator with EF hand domain protein 1 n=1 Tax=Periophthalmus magnuspinnatus TaxID=409849 RepID=UPI002436DDB4|nr:cell growth regulator with EF hand domain protein 1 [Periophthalmus magnuspinnatus]
MASRLSWSVLSGFLLLLFVFPGQPATLRDEEAPAGLANPFKSGEESHRLLQSYIDSILKEGQARPEISSREQEVFFLFRLHDYDRGGFLDGLEMIKLLSDYNTFHKPAAYQYNTVVSLVDFLLQTQDLNHDGLFSPSELLSPPLIQTQHKEATQDQKDSAQNKVEVKMETQPQQKQTTKEDGVLSADEQHPPQDVRTAEHTAEQTAEQTAQVTAEQTAQTAEQTAEQTETVAVPVHQGQPEI